MTSRRVRTVNPSQPAAKRRGRPLEARPNEASIAGEEAVPGLIVRADPLRTRIEKLTKEHDRLLREIGKKRAQLEGAEALSRELFGALLSRTMPMRERLREALRDIQTLFVKLLGAASRLSRRDKAKVRRVYEDLVVVLDLPTLEEAAAEAEVEAEASSQDEPESARKPRPGTSDSNRPNFGGGGYSAQKPPEASHPSLRALFKRLALAFHPDKVQDEQAKAERTSLMKDVTKAYESGDLARLMELERALLSRLPLGDEPGALERRAKELLAANTELRRQQRALTAALKELTLELPFDVNLKAADAKQHALREVDNLVRDLEQEERRVTGLRNFVRDFADGRIALADFLAGPRVTEESEVSDMGEDLLLDLIEDLLHGSPMPVDKRGQGRSGHRRHRA